MRRTAGAAAAALTALALAACSPTDDTGSKAPKASPTTVKTLRMGQPSEQTVELSSWGKTGQFTITPLKAVPGKPADLNELNDPKYKGWRPLWVYINAKFVDGDPQVKGPMVMQDVGVLLDDDAPVQRLLVMLGDLNSKPADCTDDDPDAIWKKGDNHTKCALWLIPEAKTAAAITYSRGWHQHPLKWTVGSPTN